MGSIRQTEEGGPNGLALSLEASIAELELEKAAVRRSERRPINQRLHTLRSLLAWCKTRSGYIETPRDLGLYADEN